MHKVRSGCVRSVNRSIQVFKTPKVDFKVLNDVCQTGVYAAVKWTAVEL